MDLIAISHFYCHPAWKDYVGDDNPVRVVDAYVDELDSGELGFARVAPKPTGRPSYHPTTILKIYIYGYLNQVQSTQRLEREAGCNIELMWLTGHLAPDFKIIANFRKDNGAEAMDVLADRGYFSGPQVKACAELGATPHFPKLNTSGAKAAGRFDRADFIYDDEQDVYHCPAGEELSHRFTSQEKGLMLGAYWSSACPDCAIKSSCATGKYRRIKRWEHEGVIENMLQRPDKRSNAMTIRRPTVEHVFGALKHWMGPCHFLTKGLKNVATEMSLSVLAYNIKRLITIIGVKPIIRAIRA